MTALVIRLNIYYYYTFYQLDRTQVISTYKGPLQKISNIHQYERRVIWSIDVSRISKSGDEHRVPMAEDERRISKSGDERRVLMTENQHVMTAIMN